MAVDISRRSFVAGSAATLGAASVTLGGPISAYAQRAKDSKKRPKTAGYGPLVATAEEDSGIKYLALPVGFKYRLINRAGAPMRNGLPTPGIFDGTGAYPGLGGRTILIRNHENRSRPGEVTVPVATGKRYDPDVNVRGGNTKLVVGKDRRLQEIFPVLGGTHTNCAGGITPWNSWITCEEIFNYGATETNVTPGTGVPHGYCFEVDAATNGAVPPQPILDAGRFAHEAVAWFGGSLYETEDRGDACLYRFTPEREPKEAGDLASFGGKLEALVVRGRPNFDADAAQPGESYQVEWVTVDEPNPLTDTVRYQAQARGAAIFNRTEGIWATDKGVYFDCTSGGDAGLGQLWELRPRGRDGGVLKLIFESETAEDLEAPDNLVVVPSTGDVFLQEDGPSTQYVRGVTPKGLIYDFARTILNPTEFCGGCFSPDGATFFVSQQGDRLVGDQTPASQPDSIAGLTFAIWGGFDKRKDD